MSAAIVVDEYQQAGIVERHEVVNRSNGDWPTSADPAGADQRDGAARPGVYRRGRATPGAGPLMLL